MGDDDFHSYRRRALDAKGRYCHLCDATEDIVVHHINGDRTDNDLENLLPVCDSCHDKIHAVTGDPNGSQYHQLAAQLKDKSERDGEPGGVERITVSIPNEVYKQLMDDLSYGDNRSELVAKALREYYDMETEA